MSTNTDSTTAWSPDIRWALPAVLSVWVWALGWLPMWAARNGDGFSPWLMGGFGVVAGLVGVWRARAVWTPDVYGESLREQGSVLAVLSGIGVGVWLVRAGYTSPWVQTPLLLLLAGIGGGWFAALVTVAPRHAEEEVARQQQREQQSDEQRFRELLDESDSTDVRLYGVDETRAGHTLEIGPDPSFPKRPNFSDVERKLPDMTTNFAIDFRERDGTILEEGDLRLERIAADRWLLHVSSKHVLRETIPFHLSKTPATFNDPIWLGLYEDGQPMRFTLFGRHMKIVGATGGGKSVIVNNIIARALECRSPQTGEPDAVVHVVASEKLIPLVYPWLIPWFERRTARPAIDLIVGEDPDDCIDYLRRLYYFVKDRNARLGRKSKHTATPAMPAVVVFIEEAKVLTGYTDPIEMAPEQFWNVSRLLAETAALARSAGVSIVPVTQVGLFDGLGAYGDELQRHLTIRACTVTMTPSDGYNTLPNLPANVDTTALRNYSMYLQVGIGEDSRAMPGKVADLDEDRVPAVAERLSERLATLSGRDVAALDGDTPGWYAGRYDADRVPLLVGAAANDEEAPGGGYAWPPLGALPVPVLAVDEPEPVPDAEHDEETSAVPEAPTPPGDDVNVAWLPEWDDELNRLLGRPEPEQPTDPTGNAERPKRRGTPGMPTDADIARLEDLSRRIVEESEQMLAEPVPGPQQPAVQLPQPLAAVIAWLDAQPDAPEWVSTAELAAEVFGEGVSNATVKMGKGLSRNWPGLRATEPRDLPGGGRGRGFLVADLYRAAVAIRDGEQPPEPAE